MKHQRFALITVVAVFWYFTMQAYPQSSSGIAPASTEARVSPVPQAPSLIESVKKSVIFIEADCLSNDASGRSLVKPFAGTGFLLSVPDGRLGADKGFTYVVTNRHVAQPGVEADAPCHPVRYILRVELRTAKPDGSFADVAILSPSQLQWTYSSDESVDLAIAPIGLNTELLDAMFIPSTLLMSSDEMKAQHVEEGDGVLFSGLFVQLIGQKHSEPIVRTGKIAMIPKEPVPTTLRKLGNLLLVDCHVFGGNSGSPMFINLGGQRGGILRVGDEYKLLGVVSGYVKESSDFSLQTVASYAGTVDANSGVATVVPAQDLLNLVNSPPLKIARDEEVQRLTHP